MIWNNVITTPNRWMAYWLRRRGWVVFYLDPVARIRCAESCCWLNLYYDAEAYERRRQDDRERSV